MTAIPFLLSTPWHEEDVEVPLISEADTERYDGRRYPDVNFAATHNSYSGGIDGRRSSIRAQLDSGVRSLELDVHDDDYELEGFRVGHLAPGDAVYHEGDNPAGDQLSEWLKIIADWSAKHRDHAPITLLIDLKDSFAEGELFELNGALLEAFGGRLVAAENIRDGVWPTIGELRGRILVVLSGDEESRVSYRGQHGKNPAVAINSHGSVVLVQDDGDDQLWSWTGQYVDDGSVFWVRRDHYDTGLNPAVAIDQTGIVVEAHESDGELWYRTGRVDRNLQIHWAHDSGMRVGEFVGSDVTIDFAPAGRVRLTFREAEHDARLTVEGRLDLGTGRIVWSDRPMAGLDASDETRDASFARTIRVYTGEDGGFDRDTLLYATDRAGPIRVRPPQLAFVEVQHGNEGALAADGLYFYSGPAAELSARMWAIGKRAAGKVARLWCFNDADLTQEASVNFPATDLPFSRWYRGYGNTLGCAR